MRLVALHWTGWTEVYHTRSRLTQHLSNSYSNNFFTLNMHPPLDRPHPECMQEIDDLYHCHATTSKIKFWGCNDVKFALDQCLKKEKQNLLLELNKDAAAKRAAEEDAYQKALGKEMSFEDYLKKDKDYNKAMEERKRMEESKQKN